MTPHRLGSHRGTGRSPQTRTAQRSTLAARPESPGFWLQVSFHPSGPRDSLNHTGGIWPKRARGQARLPPGYIKSALARYRAAKSFRWMQRRQRRLKDLPSGTKSADLGHRRRTTQGRIPPGGPTECPSALERSATINLLARTNKPSRNKHGPTPPHHLLASPNHKCAQLGLCIVLATLISRAGKTGPENLAGKKEVFFNRVDWYLEQSGNGRTDKSYRTSVMPISR